MQLRNILNQLKLNNQKAFIPFVVAGDPDLKTTESILLKLEEIGADIIELGVPFNDPTADGKTIANAHERALQHSITLNDCCTLIQQLRAKNFCVPIVLFTYFNLIFQMGIETFVKLVAQAGINAILIVDLPFEEIDELQQILKQHNVGIVLLVSPNTSEVRLKNILSKKPEFIYYISRKSITGTQTTVSETLHREIHYLRTLTDLPIAIGFGISTPQQCTQIASIADGVIIGSALVKCLDTPSLSQQRHTLAQSLNNLYTQAQSFRNAIK